MRSVIMAAVDAVTNSGPVLHLRQRRYERFFAVSRGKVLFRGTYGSFAEAERTAPRLRPTGYDNPDSTAIHNAEVAYVNPRDYPVMFWLGEAVRGGARRIVDLGGNVGHKFHAFGKYLSYPDDLTWTVCDVPAIVEAGRELARGRPGSERLAFTTRFQDVDGCDLLLAAGVLQYIEEPLQVRLARLRQRPARLLLNGVPLHPERSFVTLQNIGTAFCPYHIFQREEFVAGLKGAGYVARDEWRNPERHMRVPFHATARVDAYSGLYLEARN